MNEPCINEDCMNECTQKDEAGGAPELASPLSGILRDAAAGVQKDEAAGVQKDEAAGFDPASGEQYGIAKSVKLVLLARSA